MEDLFIEFADKLALGLELIAILVIAFGALSAVAGLIRPKRGMRWGGRKRVWVNFGVWLLLGLEFMLAADIVRSAISPTWPQLGQLAVIAVVRTFLNYFLEKDVEKYGEAETTG